MTALVPPGWAPMIPLESVRFRSSVHVVEELSYAKSDQYLIGLAANGAGVAIAVRRLGALCTCVSITNVGGFRLEQPAQAEVVEAPPALKRAK